MPEEKLSMADLAGQEEFPLNGEGLPQGSLLSSLKLNVLIAWQAVFQVRSLVILGSMFVAIVCGTSNAFGSISGQIAEAEDFANWQTSLLSTAAFLGMYVTVFAGMAYDRVGPLWTVSVGASITVSGYVIVSICRGNEAGYGFMVFGYLLVSFGSGGAFSAAMGTGMKALPENTGVGIAMPGTCMSLSMAFTTVLWNAYENASGCSSPDCWPGKIGTLAIVQSVCFSIGWLLIASGTLEWPCLPELKPVVRTMTGVDINIEETHSEGEVANSKYVEKSHPTELDKAFDAVEPNLEDNDSPVTVVQSLKIVINFFFLLLLLSYFSCIAMGLIVVIFFETLWVNFGGSPDSAWVSVISIGFSVANASFNLVGGFTSDWLVRRGWLSRGKFIGCYELIWMLIMITIGVMSFFSSSNAGIQAIFAILLISVGGGWGMSYTMFPTIVGEEYGFQNFGVYFGYCNFGSAVASIVTPQVVSLLGNHVTDGYSVAVFLVAGLLGLSGMGVLFKNPTPPGVFW